MRLLLLKEEVKPEGEPLFSLLCGAPSLSIGLGAFILITSYCVGRPIGPASFYKATPIRIERTNEMGQVLVTLREYIFPSEQLVAMLFVGACLGGLGIHLARRRGRQRKATTSAADMIACAAALILAWGLLAWAAAQDLRVTIR
jgi:hypothetical protein